MTTGVTPVFSSEISGNGDTIFDPGEVWLYTATGTALDLTLPPPSGVHTVANSCTEGGAQPPSTAYTNIGTVTMSGVSATDPSSYCNPPAPPPPPGLGKGDTATIGFWHNKNGQAVINCVNGGSTSTGMGNYLSSTYPSLFGAGPGSIVNLAGKTNAQIAAIYLGSSFFGAGGMKVNAQILGAALATYVTSSTLSGAKNCGGQFGFNFSPDGTGVKTYNVGTNGHLIGLVDNTSYTIFQLLQAANTQKAAGTFNAAAFTPSSMASIRKATSRNQ
jgi:hypothetical protein